MNPDNYYKDPPRLIYELMKKTFGSAFNEYYLESPTMIYEAAYPCLIVESASSSNTIQDAPTSTDNVREEINIYLLLNSKDDINASGSEDTTKRKLYQLVQGRNPDTGFYLPNTVMYALRTNISLYNSATANPTTIDQDVDINYDVQPRGDQPTLLSAIVTITTKERVIVQARM